MVHTSPRTRIRPEKQRIAYLHYYYYCYEINTLQQYYAGIYECAIRSAIRAESIDGIAIAERILSVRESCAP
jgi:hypothetical protein